MSIYTQVRLNGTQTWMHIWSVCTPNATHINPICHIGRLKAANVHYREVEKQPLSKSERQQSYNLSRDVPQVADDGEET